jgi:hypothetical protein
MKEKRFGKVEELPAVGRMAEVEMGRTNPPKGN